MRRSTLRVSVAAATTALLLNGCVADNAPPTQGEGPASAADSGYPVTVGDLTLTEQPTAIVSLSGTVTEMLFTIGAGDQVVAVEEHSTYPPEAPTTELSGFEPNPEAIASYDPDLVIASYDPGNLVDQLDALDIPVHLVSDDPRELADIYTQMTDLGALTGNVDDAAEVVESMSTEIDEIVRTAPAPEEPLTYYVEIDETPFAYTSQSLISNLFERVGLENIAATDDPAEVSMQLTPEYIVDANPDFIFLANAQYGMTADAVASRDGWADVTAVREGNVVELSPDIASRWGPRVVDLLREVVNAVAQAA